MSMNLPNPNQGNSTVRHSQIEALNDIYRQLKKLNSEFTSGPIADAATETTLSIISSYIINTSGTTDDILSLTQRANWSVITGNSIEYTYYAGIEAGNPSGTTTNVKTVVYKTGVTTIFTQTIAYNAADLAISIVTT